MLKLGIVGTSFISHDFITAALLTKDYVLEGIYSRTKSRGDDFLKTIEKKCSRLSSLGRIFSR